MRFALIALVALVGLGCGVAQSDTVRVLKDEQGITVGYAVGWINPPELQAELDAMRHRIAVLECRHSRDYQPGDGMVMDTWTGFLDCGDPKRVYGPLDEAGG